MWITQSLHLFKLFVLLVGTWNLIWYQSGGLGFKSRLRKKAYPVLKAPTHYGVWGREFLGSLSLGFLLFLCKEADLNPGPPGHKWRYSTTAPGPAFKSRLSQFVRKKIACPLSLYTSVLMLDNRLVSNKWGPLDSMLLMSPGLLGNKGDRVVGGKL
jgi:hypothetical protein